MKNFRTSIENKYTSKCTFAIEIQIDKLFTLVWVTSINKFSCKYFSIKGIQAVRIEFLYARLQDGTYYGIPLSVHPSIRFTCHALTSEPLGQFTSNFTELLELMVYFLVKFGFFIPELWVFIHQIVGDFSYVAL